MYPYPLDCACARYRTFTQQGSPSRAEFLPYFLHLLVWGDAGTRVAGPHALGC